MFHKIQFTPNINIPQTAFRAAPQVSQERGLPLVDGFVTNPLFEKIADKAFIEAEAKSNPRIREMFSEKGLPIRVNIKELEKLQSGHLKNTRITAAKIYSALPGELKREVNGKNLQEAAMLHDYGKVLIPDSILNKAGGLTEQERKIMEMHSELGYELLKNKGADEAVRNLVKYHHQTPAGTGYPAVGAEYRHKLESEIIAAADKYNALTENRSYKSAMKKEDALAVIREDVGNGIISREVYEALLKSV